MRNRRVGWIVIGIVVIAFNLQGCAGSSGLSGSSENPRTYQSDYQTMKEVVETAIKGGSLDIIEVSEPESGETRTVIKIAKSDFTDRQSLRTHQGIVTVKKEAENKTSVEVENPDYHYTVPGHKREDYERLVFSAIKDQLNK